MQKGRMLMVAAGGMALVIVLDWLSPGAKVAGLRSDRWWTFVPWLLIIAFWGMLLVRAKAS